jgi:hypothetical protein
VSTNQKLEVVKRLIDYTETIQESSYDYEALKAWSYTVTESIKNIFGEDTEEFRSIQKCVNKIPNEPSHYPGYGNSAI